MKMSGVDKSQVTFGTQANQMSYDPGVPTYSLSIQNDSKKPFRIYRTVEDEEEEIMVQPKETEKIRDKDQLRFGLATAVKREVNFTWHPVSVAFHSVEDSQDKQTRLAQIGLLLYPALVTSSCCIRHSIWRESLLPRLHALLSRQPQARIYDSSSSHAKRSFHRSKLGRPTS